MAHKKFVALVLFVWGPIQAIASSLAMMRSDVQTRTSMSVPLALRQSAQVKKKVTKLEYFGRIFVGDPSQEFIVVYDTGSGNLIIPMEDCTSKACLTHRRFNESASKTAKHLNCDGSVPVPNSNYDGITITFGTGQVTGRCMQDKICIGAACSEGAFIAATQESTNPFSEFRFDGVLGLARESMAQSPFFALMSRLNDKLQQPLFSVFLSASDSEVSEITFGDIKRDHLASEPFWVPVVPESSYWGVRVKDITFNTKQTGLCTECLAALDTGTSEIAGPTHVINKLRKLLNVAQNCSNFHELPHLGFIIGDKILRLPPSDYVERYVEGKDSVCSLKLMTLDLPPPKGPLMILGIPFLQKYYSVYDPVNSRVALAVAKHQDEESIELLTLEPLPPSRPQFPTFLSRTATY